MSSYLQKFITYFIYKSPLICIFQVILKNFSPFYQKTSDSIITESESESTNKKILNTPVFQ